MNQRPQTPTPEQQEAMRQATAFAYGYSLAMSNRTGQEHYTKQATQLEEDLKLFGCIHPGTVVLKNEYLDYWDEGRRKALAQLGEILP